MSSTLAWYMFGQFSLLQYLEFFLRILIACICGACIGYERTKRLKEAGVRTHIIVCCAAALTMLISKYAFSDLISPVGAKLFGTNGTDPARLAAQIISGVSFLGAGMIFRTGNSTHGLTTAAGIWATAAIGLAIGAGMYVIGLFATLIIAVIQIIMHRFTIGTDSTVIGLVSCMVVDAKAFRQAFNEYADKHRILIISTKISFLQEGAKYELNLRLNNSTTITDLIGFLNETEGVKTISCEISR